MYDLWVDFNEIDDDHEMFSLLEFATTDILTGQTIVVGDDGGNRCQGIVVAIQDDGGVRIRVDLDTFTPAKMPKK